MSINVTDLSTAERFYSLALGFERSTPVCANPVLASLLGVKRVETMLMQRGQQMVEIAVCNPAGAPYTAGSLSNDCWFQHCALVTDDIGGAYGRLCANAFTPISCNGPEILPGGIIAFKFRDADLHPWELIQFPQGDSRTAGGIDHSAIVVGDADRSIAFYMQTLGLTVRARQTNTGPAQDALDGLSGTEVDVVALCPAQPAPHLELLGYRQPRGRGATAMRPSDRAATRLVFGVNAEAARLMHDPDGHTLLLLPDPH